MNFVSVVKYLRISRAVVRKRAEAQLLERRESNPIVLTNNSTEPGCCTGNTKLGVGLQSVALVWKGPKKGPILCKLTCCIDCVVPSTVDGATVWNGHMAYTESGFLLKDIYLEKNL